MGWRCSQGGREAVHVPSQHPCLMGTLGQGGRLGAVAASPRPKVREDMEVI